MLSKSQIDVLTKYWEKYGGPNFFDPRPFQMFKIKKTSKSNESCHRECCPIHLQHIL